MKNLIKSVALLLLSVFILSCGSDNKITVFNGENLDNWNVFVSNPDELSGDLFWVEDGVINTSGKPHGYIRTKATYSNYKLQLEWKWTEEPTNSGVLIHVQGQDMIWPHCVEAQLKHGNAGDLVLMGKGAAVTYQDSTYMITSDESRYKSIPKLEDTSEKPVGEWNSYEITTLDGDIEIIVNGVVQFSGTDVTPTEGNILLQSEGSAMQFRNIYLEEL